MHDPALCTEAEITQLVHQFYARVREDKQLGPIFNHHVVDWPEHLGKLVDFWSALLRGTKRFSGAPMPKHVVLSDLHAALFRRWLTLFRQTAQEQPNQAMVEEACTLAARIAERLWGGYQQYHGLQPMCPVHEAACV